MQAVVEEGNLPILLKGKCGAKAPKTKRRKLDETNAAFPDLRDLK